MKNIERTMHGRQMLVRQFSGISELQRWIKSTPIDSGWDDTTKKRLSYDFTGAHTYEEASESLLKGSNVQELKKAITKGKGTCNKKKLTLGVVGACPNVPAVLAGSPANMYSKKRVKTPGAYNVYVDVAVSGFIRKQQIYDAGVEILIKVLQLANKYPVNLYVGDLASHGRKVYGSAVQIMNAGKSFNVARVSYALTEPGFLRVFTFCVSERSGKFWPSSASSGYGTPLETWERKEVVDNVFKNAIILSTKEVIDSGDRAFAEIDKILK